MNKNKPAGNHSHPAAASRPWWLLPMFLTTATVAVVALLVWFVQARQGAVAYTPTVTGQPQAVLDQTSFDYGDVKLGTTIETVFHVKNTGDRALAILGEPRVEVLEGC